MQSRTLQQLLDQVRSGERTRRSFIRQATALGVSAAAAGTMVQHAVAQDASPEAASPVARPAGTGEAIRSITRAEYFQQLKEHFAIEEALNPGGQLVHTYTTDISTLNPIVASDTYSQMIVGWIYEGLVGTSMIDGSIVPSGLADYWEIAEDGVTYTVHLNPDATWQDGVPVTADDVIFTIDAVIAENSPSIRTAVVNEFLAGHEKVDDHTVRLISRQPSAVFLNRTVNQFAIMPKHVWEDVPLEEMASDAGSTGQDVSRVVGSGPFRLGEWQLGARVVLERNDDYWDQDNVPYIDQYIFNVVEDANTQVASLQTGETDLAGISSGQVDALRESNPELQFAEYDTGTMNIFFFNHSSEKFSDINVRQAMSYAVDKEVFANVIQDGYAVPAAGTIPPISPAYNPDAINNPYPYDPELAGQLLEEAG